MLLSGTQPSEAKCLGISVLPQHLATRLEVFMICLKCALMEVYPSTSFKYIYVKSTPYHTHIALKGLVARKDLERHGGI